MEELDDYIKSSYRPWLIAWQKPLQNCYIKKCARILGIEKSENLTNEQLINEELRASVRRPVTPPVRIIQRNIIISFTGW